MTPEQFTQLLEAIREINHSVQNVGIGMTIMLLLIVFVMPRK